MHCAVFPGPHSTLDILIEPTRANARRLLDALIDAGLGTASLTNEEEVLSNEITIFSDRIRIDVQTKTPGIVFSEAWDRKKVMDYRGQSFFIVCLQDLIASKKASGRDIDLEDVRLLDSPKDDSNT